MRIYVIMGSAGEYGDRTSWIAAIYPTKEAAWKGLEKVNNSLTDFYNEKGVASEKENFSIIDGDFSINKHINNRFLQHGSDGYDAYEYWMEENELQNVAAVILGVLTEEQREAVLVWIDGAQKRTGVPLALLMGESNDTQ